MYERTVILSTLKKLSDLFTGYQIFFIYVIKLVKKIFFKEIIAKERR